MSPSIHRAMAAAIGAGLARVDLTSREHGFHHGVAGALWHVGDGDDLLDYSLGYADGQAERAMIVSEHTAARERTQ